RRHTSRDSRADGGGPGVRVRRDGARQSRWPRRARGVWSLSSRPRSSAPPDGLRWAADVRPSKITQAGDRRALARRSPRRLPRVRLATGRGSLESSRCPGFRTMTAQTHRRRARAGAALRVAGVVVVLTLVVRAIALAHAVVYPKTSTAGAFERYVIRV